MDFSFAVDVDNVMKGVDMKDFYYKRKADELQDESPEIHVSTLFVWLMKGGGRRHVEYLRFK
jgi:hypothetical protein